MNVLQVWDQQRESFLGNHSDGAGDILCSSRSALVTVNTYFQDVPFKVDLRLCETLNHTSKYISIPKSRFYN